MNALRPTMRLAQTTTRSFSTTRPSQLARMQVIGRLAAAPELKPTSTGHELIKYTIASDYGPRDSRQTSWFNVAAFMDDGARRQHLLGLPKGTMVHVDADAQMTSFEDSETGKKRSSLNLIHRSLEVLTRPRADTQGEAPTSAAEQPDSGLGAS